MSQMWLMTEPTALTALQLRTGEGFELPACVGQMSQLRELQLFGDTVECHRSVPCIPSLLTGLTFLANSPLEQEHWAGQLQQHGSNICSLEVNFGGQCHEGSRFLEELVALPPAAGQAQLPHLTKLVFKRQSVLLDPARKSFVDISYGDDLHMVTSLKVCSLNTFAGDGSFDNFINLWPSEADPRTLPVMAARFPALRELTGLQQLELCNLAGVNAAVLAVLTTQLPALQVLQLEGCSEGVRQWHTVAAPTTGASGSGPTATAEEIIVAGGVWCMLQRIRAGLMRQGMKLVVQPSSCPDGSSPLW
eukprot:gene3002-3283_t